MLSEPLIGESLSSALAGAGGTTANSKQLKNRIETFHESFVVRRNFLMSGIVAVYLSKDRSRLYAVTKSNDLIELDPQTQQINKSLKLQKHILTTLSLSLDEKIIAIGTTQGKIHVVGTETFKLKFTIDFGTIPIKAIAMESGDALKVLENDGSFVPIDLKPNAGRGLVTIGGRMFLMQRGDGTYFLGGNKEIRWHESVYTSKQIYEPRDNVLKIFFTHNYLLALLETDVCEIFDLVKGNIVDDIYIEENATYITMTRDEKTLIVADKLGKVTFYDLQFPQRYYQLQMSSQAICYLFIIEETNEILALSGEIRCGICKIPSFKAYDLLKVNSPFLMFLEGHRLAYIIKRSIFEYNLATKQTKPLLRVYGMSPVFAFIPPTHIVTTNMHQLIFFNTLNNKITQFKSELNIYTKCIALSPKMTSLALTTNDRTLVVFDLIQFKFICELKGHAAIIKAVNYCDDQFVITAAGNCFIVWDVIKAEHLYIEESFEASIEEVLVKEAYIYLATENSIVHIWNWKLKLPVHRFETLHTSKITKLWIGADSLLTASSDLIISWELKTHIMLFKVNTLIKNDALDISPDGRLIAYSTGASVIFKENPYNSIDLHFLGGADHEVPEFVKTVNDLFKLKKIDHKPEYTNWLIMPYKVNLGHIYTTLSLEENLRAFLESGGAVCNNSLGQNILSYSIDKNLDSCTFIIISELKKRLITNPFAFSFLNHELLVSLNTIGSELLYKLYDQIYLTSTQTGIIKFGPDDSRFPIYYHSDEFEITQNNFFNMVDEENVGEGIPVEFKQSLVKLNLEIGSNKSREFIGSLINCPYQDIFNSSLIQDLLNEKWLKLRWVHFIQGLIYFLQIVVFGILLFESGYRSYWFILLFVLNLLLTLYEVFQIYIVLLDYFNDIWNWIDLMRLSSMNFFIFLYWIDGTPNENESLYFYVNSLVTVLVFFRGISYFRLFESTRYMIDLIHQSIKDMIGFVTVLAFSVFSFAFIFYSLENPDSKSTFMSNLINSYSINLGGGEIRGGSIYALLFYLATVINPIILLNLLISILGNSFERVENSRVISNYRELANLVLEVEQLIYWTVENKATFLQSCLKPEEIEIPDMVLTKVRKLKTKMISIEEKMEELNEKVENIFVKLEESNIKSDLILNEIRESKKIEDS
jgi:WD40 repeat protein